MNIIVLNDIAILHTEDAKELTDTFMRVSEFYESDKYKDNLGITKQDIISLYNEIGEGEDYFDVFEGYNFPAYCIKEFFAVNEADEFEMRLITLPSSVTYVIGHITGDQQVLVHELAHAFYFSFDGYRNSADAITQTLSGEVRDILIKWFIKNGYDQDVYQDELQAYIVEELLEDLIEDEHELDFVLNHTKKPLSELKALFYSTLSSINGHEVLGLGNA